MISYTSAVVIHVTIALDATPLTISAGGVRRYTLELARALAENYPDDQYWLLSDQAFTLPERRPGNLHRGTAPSGAAERRWWMWGLDREMARLGVQLFHGTDFAVPYLRRRATVMTVHDLSPWLGRDQGAERVRRRTPVLLRLGLASMVVTPTEAIRRAVVERFRLTADRVVAVPLAAGEEFRPVARTAAGTPYFLFVGALEPRKNIARLVEAWREVRGLMETDLTQVDLVLAGRARANFTALPEEPGLRVLGEVADADLPALYSNAVACVYPSLYEGFGLPALEAMQCGAVVIASRDPAIQEVTGDAAVHVDARDTRALVEAMLAVARKPASFAALGEKAIDRASLFSWARTARLTREVYDQAGRIFRG